MIEEVIVLNTTHTVVCCTTVFCTTTVLLLGKSLYEVAMKWDEKVLAKSGNLLVIPPRCPPQASRDLFFFFLRLLYQRLQPWKHPRGAAPGVRRMRALSFSCVSRCTCCVAVLGGVIVFFPHPQAQKS